MMAAAAVASIILIRLVLLYRHVSVVRLLYMWDLPAL
jgi:hypothetical protein